MSLIKRFECGLARLESLANYLGALSILLLGCLITASVIGRAVFNAGIPDTIVIAGLLLIPVVALPMAFVQSQDGHIAVTVTTDWMPKRFISALKALSNIVGFIFFGAIIWFMLQKVPRDIATGAYYDGEFNIPVWPMKLVFALGIALFLIRLIVDLWRNLRSVFGYQAP